MGPDVAGGDTSAVLVFWVLADGLHRGVRRGDVQAVSSDRRREALPAQPWWEEHPAGPGIQVNKIFGGLGYDFQLEPGQQ